MDAQQAPDPESEQERKHEPGSSKSELITISLFGVMVIVASVCFVIW